MRRRVLLLLLWRKLFLFVSVIALFGTCLSVLINADAWWAHDDLPAMATEIGARLCLLLLLAGTVATAVTAVCIPVISGHAAAVRRVRALCDIAIVGSLLVCGCALLGILIRWALAVDLIAITDRASILAWAVLSASLALVALVWYLKAEQRAEVSRELSRRFSGRATRRLVLGAGVAGLLTGFADRLTPGPSSRRAAVPRRPDLPNLLLVTFDALCAEDMSCYGYRLATTPSIDALAQVSTVFSNFYATSTFTTPCIASMLTGRYPSSTGVYGYGGRIRGDAALCTLPGTLHEAGYTTAASVANPGAHPDCLGFGGHFDVLPPPPIDDLAQVETVRLFRSAPLAAEVTRIAHAAPYLLEQLSPRRFGQVHSAFPPELSFKQAERIMQRLPRPFFLWIHVFAPHFPYLPDPPYLHRFLPGEELRTHAQFVDMMDRKGYNYSPSRQSWVDKGRLRYDEWIAQSDGAFGQFIDGLQSSGRFEDLAIVLSSDHGESFAGGFVGHGGAQQSRPIVHVPLLVHCPGQTQRHDFSAARDQTAVAPTLLQVAGLPVPAWMDGQALELQGAQAMTPGYAFTQYLEPDRPFEDPERGTMGVIDGRHQYVFDLQTRRGSLFDLSEAHEQRIDLGRENPQCASELHAMLRARFPHVSRLA